MWPVSKSATSGGVPGERTPRYSVVLYVCATPFRVQEPLNTRGGRLDVKTPTPVENQLPPVRNVAVAPVEESAGGGRSATGTVSTLTCMCCSLVSVNEG